MGTFTRRPQVGGDLGSWGTFQQAQDAVAFGVLTGRLYNDGAGVLTIPPCMIGIDDGTNKGVCTFSVAETISLAGCSNSNWIKIEFSVSGSATTIAASDIAGATDPTVIPASVRAAWNGEKGGFYLTVTKRLIALAWKEAGVLLAVVNFDGQKIWASQIGLHTGTIHNQYEPGKGFNINTGVWNMDNTASITPNHYFGVFNLAVSRMSCQITNNVGTVTFPLNGATDAGDPGLLRGGIPQIDNTQINLQRRTGGGFDLAAFNAATGVITVHMREF